MIEPLPAFINDFFPPGQRLFLRLCDEMTDDMLDEIAGCDYGFNIPENLEKLRKVHATHEIESRLQWEPKEVLELMRWSEPDKQDPSQGIRGHLIRSFSCTILLLAGADPANDDYIDGENETLAQTLESCLFLGPTYCQQLGELLTWRYPNLHDYDNFPLFVIFALIDIALNIQTCSISRGQTAQLVDQLSAEETRLRGTEEDPWIFHNRKYRASFLGMELHDQNHKKWLYFASALQTNYPEHVEVSTLTANMLKDRHWANL